MEATRLEVALIAWTPGGGTLVLGRLDDPDLVAVMRDRLAERLSSSGCEPPKLRLAPDDGASDG